MNCAAADSHTTLERVLRSVVPRTGRKQSGVHVDDAARKAPEQGRALVGQEIRIPRSALPDSGTDSWYWSDLIGLSVVNEEGVSLGTVKQMIETGANDVMVLDGDRERLVPFVVEQVVKTVDLDAREIRVNWHPDD